METERQRRSVASELFCSLQICSLIVSKLSSEQSERDISEEMRNAQSKNIVKDTSNLSDVACLFECSHSERAKESERVSQQQFFLP